MGFNHETLGRDGYKTILKPEQMHVNMGLGTGYSTIKTQQPQRLRFHVNNQGWVKPLMPNDP